MLVALNGSHAEKGLMPRLESLPTPNIAITLVALVMTVHDNSSYGHSVALAINSHSLQDGDSEDESNTGDGSTRTPEKVGCFHVSPSSPPIVY